MRRRRCGLRATGAGCDAWIQMRMWSCWSRWSQKLGVRLQAGVELKVNAKPMLETLEDSLSNSVQLTEMRGTLAESFPAELEQLLRMYVEPLKLPSTRRKASGRGAIVSTMRTAFEQRGRMAVDAQEDCGCDVYAGW